MRRALCILPLAVFGMTSSAQAFCRMTTVQSKAQSCPDACVTEGTPLAWQRSHLFYSFNEGGIPGITKPQLTDVYERAFGTWERIACSEQSIGFEIRKTPEDTTSGVVPEGSDPSKNINAILAFSAEEWVERMHSPAAFALTSTWYIKDTGEIVGADTYFNAAMDFTVCPSNGCPLGKTDLLNVATHEAGHFLGLAHSEIVDATMWCGAGNEDLSKRDLAADDIAGMCEAYPPGESFPDDVPQGGDDSGCSTGTAGGSPLPWLGALGTFGFLSRRRRRKP